MPVNTLKSKRQYSNGQWEDQKERIIQLRKTERRTLANVVQKLSELGFHITYALSTIYMKTDVLVLTLNSERQLRGRCSRWGIDKKHKYCEMRTAVQLMASSRTRLSENPPNFRIRGEIVEWDEVVRYFRRKGISDPLQHIREADGDGFVASSQVELLTPDSSEDDLSSLNQSFSDPDEDDLTSGWMDVGDLDRLRNILPLNTNRESSGIGNRLHQEMSLLQVGSNQTTPFCIIPTVIGQQLLVDQMVSNMGVYCTAYLSSSRAVGHTEPSVHSKTMHGIFGQRMQDGMALVRKHTASTNAQGCQKFQAAFNMIQALLQDDHPMTFALIMTVLCELLRDTWTAPLARNLIMFIRHKTLEIPNVPPPLYAIFDVLSNGENDILNLVLLAMRCTVYHLHTTAGQLEWKTMYVTERLCDCLTYSVLTPPSTQLLQSPKLGSPCPPEVNSESHINERSLARQKLLREQEAYYGKTARNVLYTLTNVADDFSELGHHDLAKQNFRDCLLRADSLDGYHKAKTQFVAYEGLGMALLRQAHGVYVADEFSSPTLLTPVERERVKILQDRKIELMQDAIAQFCEAERVGSEWFDEGVRNRRTVRVVEKVTEVRTALLFV